MSDYLTAPEIIPPTAVEIMRLRAEIERLNAQIQTNIAALGDLSFLLGERKHEVDRLRTFALSIGRCHCEAGMCHTKGDLQCRAREALDGISNEQERP